jgi:two-component system, OmpR family, response regulator
VDAVAKALRYEGYAVTEASTGREALDAVTRHEPDLVVLDWMLPDLDGIEVGRRLRSPAAGAHGGRTRAGSSRVGGR